MSKVLRKNSVDSKAIDGLSKHVGTFFQRKVTRADIFGAEPDALKFNRTHTFVDGSELGTKHVPITSRLKLGFETELLRLNWIQALTVSSKMFWCLVHFM